MYVCIKGASIEIALLLLIGSIIQHYCILYWMQVTLYKKDIENIHVAFDCKPHIKTLPVSHILKGKFYTKYEKKYCSYKLLYFDMPSALDKMSESQ